jgi:hypothetical protein
MRFKKIIVNFIGWSIIGCFVINVIFGIIQLIPIAIELSQLKIYPENVSDRQVGLSENFSLLWSKKVEDGNQYQAFAQIFVPDGNSIVYATKTALASLEYATGDLKWSVATPLNSFFYYYEDRLFSLNKYDEKVLFVPNGNIDLPIECSYSDSSTLRTYDSHTGQIIWEYSYPFTEPNDISFKENSMFIDGFSVALTKKYIPELEIDIDTGNVIGSMCQFYSDIGYSSTGRTEGVLSSGFMPVYDDLSWKLLEEGQLAMVPEGTRLTMMHPDSRQPLGFIEFLGSDLNPFDVQMVFYNNILIVHLDDSDQFFAFRVDN